MSSDGNDDAWVGELLAHRQVIPRWHTPASAAASGERDAIRPNAAQKAFPAKWLHLLRENVERGEAHAAVELEETSFIFTGRSSGSESVNAEELATLRGAWNTAAQTPLIPSPPPTVKGFHDVSGDARSQVKLIRASLRANPAQPFLWSELSRNHLILGSDEPADRAMQCALQLARGNSYLRRSSARLYLHLNRPDRALSLVKRSLDVRADPRLMAAEIALSESVGGKSNWGRAATQMLADKNYRPRFLSDLSAALATVEMSHGKHKHARQLFANSLLAPSENSLAQAQWASERDDRIKIPPEAWQTPFPHEAQALAARVRLDWDSVLDASERWLADEPYSIRPAAVGSFASFSSDQHSRSERLASAGLESSPDNRMLLNNRAVARCYLGNFSGAYSDIRKALRVRKNDDPVLIATMGLLAYRTGQPSVGSRCYGSAMRKFATARNKPSLALAFLFWLREEINCGSPNAASDFALVEKNILRITGGRHEPELVSMLQSVKAQMLGEQQSFLVRDSHGVSTVDLDQLFAEYGPEMLDDSTTADIRRTLD